MNRTMETTLTVPLIPKNSKENLKNEILKNIFLQFPVKFVFLEFKI